MNIKKHGVTVGIDQVGEEFFLSLKAQSTLTHQDYEVITPIIDSALKGVESPKVKALIDGTELDGWELRAAWDDFRLGLRHGSEFKKIAIYGNKPWQETLSKVGRWFISGEVKYFECESDAIDWLNI